jgi:hypothetical protein
MRINLQANNESQQRILDYLEENASDELVNKINNGVQVEQDGKQLLSKKDMDSFFTYAQNQAREQTEKGKNYACIEDKTVYSWAIHYFEEDSIKGNLYNLDGSEYKIEKPVKQTATKTEAKKPTDNQLGFFDKLEQSTPLPQTDISQEEKPEHSDNQTFDKYQLKTISAIFENKIKLE